jgi:hypothetical protein
MELVGREAAAPHEHARLWTRPDIFTRPGCDLDNLIGAASLWGRWDDNPMCSPSPAVRTPSPVRRRR